MTKTEIINELKDKHSFKSNKHYSLQEIHKMEKKKGVLTVIDEEVVKEGWLGASKGLFQVLWERRFIDTNKLQWYSETGYRHQKDQKGNVKEEFQPYVLHNLMEKYTDFQQESTAMDALFHQIIQQKEASIYLLTSPKYHCEIEGEGIKYAWGIMKKSIEISHWMTRGQTIYLVSV